MKRLLHFFWFDYHRRENDTAFYEVSNNEIHKWAERLLERRYAVHSTSCVTQGRVTLSAADVLIGHPTWDVAPQSRTGRSERNWMRDNALGGGAHPNSYVLMPWVPEFPPEWRAFMPWHEEQLEAAKLIFAISGRIWFDRTLALDASTIQGRVKDKLVHLDMAVNFEVLDRVRKATYNPPAERRLLHVSNLGSYKGFDLLLESTQGVAPLSLGSKSLAQTQQGDGNLKANGKLYPIHNLGAVDNGDEERMRAIVDGHDFYIHTASMDAQATTVLEYGVRGLVPLVTPESGFDCEHAIYLTRDAERNRDIIRAAVSMDEDELQARSRGVREQIRTRHSWTRFYDTIADRIDATCES